MSALLEAPAQAEAMTAPAADRVLTHAERDRLASLEAVVDRGLDTFIAVGRALRETHDSRLYRETHANFGDY